jgi:hypothetical protein
MRFSEEDAIFFEHTSIVFSEALGGFDSPPTGGQALPGQWVLFIILMFVTNLIVLNTLIAILGDSFDNVMAEKSLYDMREKVVLLIELNDFYSGNKK